LIEERNKLSRDFKLSRASNSDLEKKVSELAEALKKCQDEKKAAEEAAESSRRDLEKLHKTYIFPFIGVDVSQKLCMFSRCFSYKQFLSLFLPGR
jgi:seryl-tRNA synthetase